MKRNTFIAVALLVVLAGIVWAQNDPFYIVQNSRGMHITAGTQFPSLATTGMNPGDGQLHLQLISGATANPVWWTYGANAAAWIPISPIGTAVGSMSSTLATNAVDVANSVWGGTGELIFEGANEDAFENEIRTAEPTGGVATFLLPDQAVAADIYPIMWSLLATNALDVADSVWFDSNMIIFEGATGADDNEIQLEADDATADPVYILGDSPDGTNELLYTGAEDGVAIEIAAGDNWMEPVHARNPVKIWFREAPWYGGEQAPTANTGILAVCSTTGAPNIVYSYRDAQVLELDPKGTLTACGPTWAVADGMGIHADAAADEGHELTFGITAASPAAYTVGTDPAFYAQARFAIATVANTDQVYFGFRAVEGYQDADMEAYGDYLVIGVGDLADGGPGDVYQRDEVGGGGVTATDTTNNTPDWTDNEVHTLRIDVAEDGVVTWTWDGNVSTDAVAYTFTNALVVVPFLWILSDVTAGDPDVDAVTLEYGVQ